LGKIDGPLRIVGLTEKTKVKFNSQEIAGSGKTGHSGPKVQNKTKTLQDIDEFSRNPVVSRLQKEEPESGSIATPKANIYVSPSSRDGDSPKNNNTLSKSFVRQRTTQEDRAEELLKSRQKIEYNLSNLKKNS
jgi:hypothetical protein